ncbi:transcriptional regulator [Leifsonia sp. LS1]|uniref:LCP family protein n=1 Tax=unclassified Leifsonia TaxID=2663824 RepID=UPI001CBFCD34|nr:MULTISPECIES: LCP family protein [unclassified Leifsonia]UAJ79783.1 LCP family protein [Leifsonia sp. ZF2019]GIT81328.1 transcriptional regulator [Leifsonia sp. LS1]
MNEVPTRAQARAQEKSAGPSVARHGRLQQHHPLRTLLMVFVSVIAVLGVSTAGVAAYAVLDVTGTVASKKAVTLVDAKGKAVVPKVGAMDGAFNVLLAGSDSGGGNAAYGERGEVLNDVTMVLHVSADHKNATVISFPRDMFVAIPSCPDPNGGSFDAMSRQKINSSLSYGGLACTVLTVEKLTGLDIPYAGVIEFDGVIEMSNAIGGVPVCVAGDITDPYTGLDVKAGDNTLEGSQALAFLRTRHGVGDGSDLGRISNQQVFLSSLVRTIKSADTLTNPLKVYGLAKAAVNNIQLSESLQNVTTIASMAVALKDIDVSKVVFVQYPNHYVDGGVAPTVDAADTLMTALKNDQAINLTGDTGIGSQADPNAPADQAPATQAPADTATQPPADGSTDASGGSGGSADSSVSLPSDVHGQTAAQYTCSKPFQD